VSQDVRAHVATRFQQDSSGIPAGFQRGHTWQPLVLVGVSLVLVGVSLVLVGVSLILTGVLLILVGVLLILVGVLLILVGVLLIEKRGWAIRLRNNGANT